MPASIIHAPGDITPFGEAFARIRTEFEIAATFPPEVDAEADAVVARGPVVPAGGVQARVDARDIPLVTIDPLGSLDLDQAYHAERRGSGFRVHYAIADVAAFVAPGGALDRESFTAASPCISPTVARRCCRTNSAKAPRACCPTTIAPRCSGPSTSTRPARLPRPDSNGRPSAAGPSSTTAGFKPRSMPEAATSHSDCSAKSARCGSRWKPRGGISLDLPSQEVAPTADGGFALAYGAPKPVEGWNAQISLLAGMEAAKIMVDAHVGILRVVPAPEPWQIFRLQRSARGLGVPWPHHAKWADVVRGLDRANPDSAAFLTQAAHLLRGAGYAKLDPSGPVPIHSGVAAPYAHVTAPLRRLCDRYANEIVVAHCAGSAPPDWAVAPLDELVTTMQAATRREHAVDRAVVDAMECVVLAPHVGEQFDGFVVDRNKQGVVVQLHRPAIVASIPVQLKLGDPVKVTLVAVDPLTRHVELRASVAVQ